ncbi:hypothetical protein Y1Q_0003172 [Alligator mississippiensis]|uniref:Uncharacterized protein n=1 Tax=Alligator mississippiensis TaxID=8496 RepID=A0A151MDP6_ALLMI|nr:hypothetical protein Y1Q_0003172 [Alligator mississippiensis]
MISPGQAGVEQGGVTQTLSLIRNQAEENASKKHRKPSWRCPIMTREDGVISNYQKRLVDNRKQNGFAIEKLFNWEVK